MTDYPIVLAHGICRFDALTDAIVDLGDREDDSLHYFRGIRSALTAQGFRVFHSHVRWAAAVADRADDLRAELLRITEGFARWPRVHIIAHSMGGLDARHMICRHSMADRVASLSTVGTPHGGSSFADWGMRRLGHVVRIARAVGIDVAGFRDLTGESCRAFNEEVEGFERTNGVLYRTYAGVQVRSKVYRPLRFSHRIIERAEGENDGLVSRDSAAWRDDCFVRAIEGDHLNEVGWWDLADADYWRHREEYEARIRDFYVEIATTL